MTIKTLSVSQLKARLSEQLRIVKAGERVVVTERGRPVAMLVPLERDDSVDTGLAELAEKGLVRLGSGELSADFLTRRRPPDADGRVLAALLDEREAGL